MWWGWIWKGIFYIIYKSSYFCSQLVLDQIVEKSMEKCGCIPPFLSSTLTENLPICTNQTIGKEATAIYEKYAYLIDYATNQQVHNYIQLQKNLKCVSEMDIFNLSVKWWYKCRDNFMEDHLKLLNSMSFQQYSFCRSEGIGKYQWIYSRCHIKQLS